MGLASRGRLIRSAPPPVEHLVAPFKGQPGDLNAGVLGPDT